MTHKGYHLSILIQNKVRFNYLRRHGVHGVQTDIAFLRHFPRVYDQPRDNLPVGRVDREQNAVHALGHSPTHAVSLKRLFS